MNHRSRPGRSLSSRPLSPSLSGLLLLSLPHRKKKQPPAESILTASPGSRSALRCRPSFGFGRGRKESVGCFAFLFFSVEREAGNQLAQPKLPRVRLGSASAPLWLLPWWKGKEWTGNGTVWNGAHQGYGTVAGRPPHATFGECASIFSLARRKSGVEVGDGRKQALPGT